MVVVVCFLLLYACYARNKGHVLHHKINTEECGWKELITCWKITRAGKKVNPALRVNPGYNG
jgi:hypothetical protein